MMTYINVNPYDQTHKNHDETEPPTKQVKGQCNLLEEHYNLN